MKIHPDCIPCILKMSLETSRLSSGREDEVKDIMEEVLRLKPMRGERWDITSPEVVRDIWNIIRKKSGQDDPLRAIKDGQNSKALKAYPRAKEIVLKSKDPFLSALKLSIGGNALDAMIGANNDPTEEMATKIDSLTIDLDHVETLRERLARSAHLIWFSDNCGEIVFDRLFIEIIPMFYKVDIVYVTRTVPILNDATLRDAEFVGLGKIVTLMENGIEEPIAGTILSKVSEKVRGLVVRADLLIAKGVGNYDSLTEEKGLDGKISYLFHGKCLPCCSTQNVGPGDLVVFNA